MNETVLELGEHLALLLQGMALLGASFLVWLLRAPAHGGLAGLRRSCFFVAMSPFCGLLLALVPSTGWLTLEEYLIVRQLVAYSWQALAGWSLVWWIVGGHHEPPLESACQAGQD